MPSATADADLLIDTLDDIIVSVSESAPALAPLFRSDQQMRLLSVLFTDTDGELAIGELARKAAVAQATASREVGRLAEHGIVVTRPLGRNTLVSANWQLPWARDLRSILMQTVGVLGQLANALGTLRGIDEAYVFGSWAARYSGEPGPPPRDVDVAIIGEVSLQSVRKAIVGVESQLHIDVNPVIIDRNRWAAKRPEPFIAHIKGQAKVSIPLANP